MLNSIRKQPGQQSQIIEEVKTILVESLQLGDFARHMRPDTHLLGNLPELDSMAVVTVIASLEQHFAILVEDDDDLTGAFATLDSLAAYVGEKQGLQALPC